MPPLTRYEYEILQLTFAWLLGFLPLFAWEAQAKWGRTPSWRPPTGVQSMGLALLMTPFVRIGLGIYLSIDRLFVPGVLQPVPRDAIWRAVWNNTLLDFALPLVGLLILTNAVPFLASKRATRTRIPDAMRAHGLAPRRTLARDALDGLALFAFIALAFIGAYTLEKTLLSGLSANSDESRYWIHITIALIVLRSAAAGLTEEFLFRGVMLNAFSRVMPFWGAALAQAIVFGFVHAGYGNWSHVLGPLAFGLGMAWVARVTSVWVAALLHTEVNIVFFAFDVSGYVPGTWALIAGLVALNLAAAYATRLEAMRLLWASLTRPLRRRAS